MLLPKIRSTNQSFAYRSCLSSSIFMNIPENLLQLGIRKLIISQKQLLILKSKESENIQLFCKKTSLSLKIHGTSQHFKIEIIFKLCYLPINIHSLKGLAFFSQLYSS